MDSHEQPAKLSTFGFSPPVPSAVQLDSGRKGTCSFTVSNASGRAIRGQPQLGPEGNPALAWLSIDDSGAHSFEVSGTNHYAVQIAVPSSVAAGSYSFRLDMRNLDAAYADEGVTEGPSVSFEVRVPVTTITPPPFPWWIVVVALVVLALVGGVIWLVMPHPAPPPPATPTPLPASPVAVLKLAEGSAPLMPNALFRLMTGGPPTAVQDADLFFNFRGGTPALRSLEALKDARLAVAPSGAATPEPEACMAALGGAGVVTSLPLSTIALNTNVCARTVTGKLASVQVQTDFTGDRLPITPVPPAAVPSPAATVLAGSNPLILRYVVWSVDVPSAPIVGVGLHNEITINAGQSASIHDQSTDPAAADVVFIGGPPTALMATPGHAIARVGNTIPTTQPKPSLPIGPNDCDVVLDTPPAPNPAGSAVALGPGALFCVRAGPSTALHNARVLVLAISSASITIDFITW